MYRTVAQIDSATNLLASWFPQYFTRVQLPESSVQGRPVYALRMRAGSGTGRRGVLVAGGTHAREMMNPDAIIDLAIDLLLSYVNGTDINYGGKNFAANEVKLVLEALDVWLLPCVNPDGREYVMTVDDMWRKNRKDNPGTPCDGVDLNRNADVVWGVAQGQTSCSPCADTYCGPSAFSEPETRNVKHLLDTERIVSFVDVHSYSELVLYPWGHALTQTSDPSKRFTGLTRATCTASIPSTYSEYMTPRDLQRFKTVAGRVVNSIAAVRGRNYTPQASRALYATTGTLGDYAYARHIANASLNKTYGFTFETGPWVGTAPESFHPSDPSLVKRDAKAGILTLLQQSVCAIELIGIQFFTGNVEVQALRSVRDELLATTNAGREWIALFERAQFGLLCVATSDGKLLGDVSEVVQSIGRAVGDKAAIFGSEEAKRAKALLRKLRTKVKIRAVKDDLDAIAAHIDQVSGRTVEQLIASLMRHKPSSAAVPATAKKKPMPKGKKARATAKSAAAKKRGR